MNSPVSPSSRYRETAGFHALASTRAFLPFGLFSASRSLPLLLPLFCPLVPFYFGGDGGGGSRYRRELCGFSRRFRLSRAPRPDSSSEFRRRELVTIEPPLGNLGVLAGAKSFRILEPRRLRGTPVWLREYRGRRVIPSRVTHTRARVCDSRGER